MQQMFARGIRVLLSVGTIGCIALSCFFAFEFGYTRGASLHLAWAYGLAAAVLDLFKPGILAPVTGLLGLDQRVCFGHRLGGCLDHLLGRLDEHQRIALAL